MMTNTRGEKHLGGKERELLDRFKRSFPQFTANLQADYKLIPAEVAADFAADMYKKSWNSVTCPRIDAVATSPDKNIILFEIRPAADFTAISSIICYAELFKMIYTYPGKIEKGIICESMSNTNRQICDRFEIRIFDVSEEPVKSVFVKLYGKQKE
ncbi:MAG: hypothetical protein WC294_09950 [Methanoregula sp.]|jgi:hypothetical protein